MAHFSGSVSLNASAAELLAQRRQSRKVLLYPFHVSGQTFKVPAAVRESYDHNSYRQAVHYCCVRAKVAAWNPNQIRHARGTEVREKWGIEAASVTLGHSIIRTTEINAERDFKKAVKIARIAG